MQYTAFLLACLITTTSTATRTTAALGISKTSNCSPFTDSNNTAPMTLQIASSKNLTDELILSEGSAISKQSAETRTFRVHCMAIYPIKMEIHFILKSKKEPDQVEDNQVSKYPNADELFTATTFISFRPEEELWFNISCASSCQPSQFPFVASLFTTQDPTDVNKLRVEFEMKKVHPTFFGEKKVNPWIKIIICATVLMLCGVVLIIVLFIIFIFFIRHEHQRRRLEHEQYRMRVPEEQEEMEMEVLMR